MIFDPAFVAKIQTAIESKDEDFFLQRLQPRRQPIKDISFASALMVSAHRAKHLNKLDELRCDVAILNLEDGVAKEYKKMALLATALFLQQSRKNLPMLVVRVNALDEGGMEEIAFLNDFYPDAIRIPKIRSKKDVQKSCEIVVDPIKLHFSIETKEAFSNLQDLAISPRIKAYYLGILDLFADLKIGQDLLKISNPTVNYILAKFLVDCASVGIKPVSFVYQDYKNLEEFEEWCRYEKEMGFEAKGCISPQQVAIVNRILKSFDKQKALYIKQRFEEMAKQGITGFVDEKYGFIDEPIYKDALNTLNK
ncbi:HpcH/HpaI aldolase/citrate lyase family protein [Nitratiruptor tergarcus]|uniref:Citrate lyase subunit beta / citryl-CoA lyase n=1 Tax=Nitratiruptor tergarcus DSM 16512 TaxID=1069081 RepID=A0A1W1WTD4_9BACT|nr:aldolase/citrate lyase family protein [Nitratiruptor tergarcus]SMC09455.1 citrate lyase subunit beta / citryl-CoA lyase [Nitratiruptor tergarcus DSM 16512]